MDESSIPCIDQDKDKVMDIEDDCVPNCDSNTQDNSIMDQDSDSFIFIGSNYDDESFFDNDTEIIDTSLEKFKNESVNPDSKIGEYDYKNEHDYSFDELNAKERIDEDINENENSSLIDSKFKNSDEEDIDKNEDEFKQNDSDYDSDVTIMTSCSNSVTNSWIKSVYSTESDSENEEGNKKTELSDVALNPKFHEFPLKPKIDLNMEVVSQEVNIGKIKTDTPEIKVIEKPIEIIDLSSDDELPDIQSYFNRKETKNSASTTVQTTMYKFFPSDRTVPDGNVIYVSRQFKETEMNRLNEIRENFEKVKELLENMRLYTLPDKGEKLKNRKEHLEKEMSAYQEKISNLVVRDEYLIEKPSIKEENLIEVPSIKKENPTVISPIKNEFVSWEDLKKKLTPDELTALGKSIKNEHPIKKPFTKVELPDKKPFVKDEFLSWDDLKKRSTDVRPRTYVDYTIETHLIQRAQIIEKLQNLHDSLETRPNEDQCTDPPKSLITPLMTHQHYALTWLAWRETKRPRGGLLADDMGLGKTLMMIALILHSKERNIHGKDDNVSEDEEDPRRAAKLYQGGTLVVCPATLLKQWYGEIQNHCEKDILKVEIHHGPDRQVKADKLASNDVVITTYNLVQRDLERKGTLMRIRWQRVILDEAHIVRNYKSLTAKSVFKLSSWSRWCLTGTPIHNKELDLFALLKFLRCSPFHELALWKKWIENKSSAGHERLNIIMKSLLLRRTKQQLQESTELFRLPEKKTIAIDVELSEEERKVYEKVLLLSRTLFTQFLEQRAARKMDYIYGRSDDMFSKVHKKMAALHGVKKVKTHEILVLLLRLRQICCHAGLIHSMLDDKQYEGECSNVNDSGNLLDNLIKMETSVDCEDEDMKDLSQPIEEISVADAISKVLSSSNPVFDYNIQSAKVEAVISCLQENVFHREDDKVIVVSQWTGVLDIIECHVKPLGYKYSTLSGKVPIKDRHEIISQFNNPKSDVKILFLSLCAGGVGLNLVGANHILLADLHWNPQLEAQAQDRIYRVGQKKPVFIYKFMCLDTVEERIKMIQDKKLAIADTVLTGVKAIQSAKLTIEDLKFLFNMT